MKPTQLQLKSYHLANIEIRVNRAFDAQKPCLFSWNSLEASPSFQQDQSDPRKWQVTLLLKHQSPAAENAPYSVSIDLIGDFYAGEGIPPEKEEDVIKVTGTSVLYGVAREVVRSITAMGPFGALILPTVSFMDCKPPPPPAPPAPAETMRVAEGTAANRSVPVAVKPAPVSTTRKSAKRPKN